MSQESNGQAADTGSAIHRAVAEFHKTSSVAASLAVMMENLKEFPLAELGTAEAHFRHYAEDERNQRAVIVACEEQIRVTLPAPERHSEEVVIVGRLDQVRRERSGLVVYDVKTGGVLEGNDMLTHYAAQLAAYQVGASTLLGEPVQRAGIIRTRDYLKTDRKRNAKPGPVYWLAPWTLWDATALLEQVRIIVGHVRSGVILAHPSADNCRFCPGISFDLCLRQPIN